MIALVPDPLISETVTAGTHKCWSAFCAMQMEFVDNEGPIELVPIYASQMHGALVRLTLCIEH